MAPSKQLVISFVVLLATVSCGGGSISTMPVQSGSLATIDPDPCAIFTSTPAASGTVISVSASDAAAYPNAISCADVNSLHNGAILVAKNVPEAAMDTVVGLDPTDNDSVATEAGAVNATSSTPGNEPINATAFALDANGALTKLVVAGDPTQTQSQIDEWIGERVAAPTSSVGSGLAAAWTTMLTDDTRFSGGSAGLERQTTIYRLNSADPFNEYYLITNKVSTAPNGLACSAAGCSRAMLSRSTTVGGGQAAFPVDSGPASSDSGTATITVGDALQGGDSASGTYAISWPQAGVQTREQFGGTWQEIFPNDLSAYGVLSDSASLKRMTSATTSLSPNSLYRFTSYNATIFRYPVAFSPNPDGIGSAHSFNVSISAESVNIAPGRPTTGEIKTDVLNGNFGVSAPRFLVPVNVYYNGGRGTIEATNGNGGVLRWKLVSTSPNATMVPTQGAYRTDFRVQTIAPNTSPLHDVLEVDTVPPHAASANSSRLIVLGK